MKLRTNEWTSIFQSCASLALKKLSFTPLDAQKGNKMAEHIPWADRLSAEVDAFCNLWKNRRWLAIIFLLIVIGFCIVSMVGWFKRGTQIETLKVDNREIKRDLRQSESENKSLSETVAPLIARAAKEFPGEEINISLKKIVDRLEQQNPLRQPIASATATVILRIQSDANISSHFMDRGGYAAIAQGGTTLLQASSHESWGNQLGNSNVQYRGVFTMPADSPAVGKPIDFLRQASYVQLEFMKMPTNSLVTGGKVIFVLNDSTRLEFEVPEQRSDDRRVFVRNLADGMKQLASNQASEAIGAQGTPQPQH
ncbi:MAG: hypothetical protein Q7J68_05515 [Thermoplasmata archaeon]|nr:hypothetical protein [Thermoplasmata archaeon]